MMNCPICQAHKNPEEILFENESWVLRKANQNLEGYLYLELKGHGESWSGLSLQQLEAYGRALHKGIEIIGSFHPEKVYMTAIAEKVPHLHVHLIPRFEGQTRGIEHIAQATGPGFPKPM